MRVTIFDADVVEPDGTEDLWSADIEAPPRVGETVYVVSKRLGRKEPHRVEEVHWSLLTAAERGPDPNNEDALLEVQVHVRREEAP